MIIQQDDRLVFTYDGEKLVIEPWGPNAFRVRATKLAELPAEDWALLPRSGGTSEISISEDSASIVNGKIRAEIDKLGAITFSNQKGEVLLKEFVRSRKGLYEPSLQGKVLISALEVEAREFKPILGGDYSLTMRFESDPEEKIYGMGQYQQPFLNLKGCEQELAHLNSQAIVPFMLSR